MITLERNSYEHKLLETFWTYKPTDEEDQKLTAILSRVCRAWMNEREEESKKDCISHISLSEEERTLVEKYNLMEHPNLEVRSRFQDVMIRFAKGKERLKRMKDASDDYLELCEATGTYLYFVRSIEIRQAKTLYDDAFLKRVKEVVISTDIHPGWLTDALNLIKSKVDNGLDNKYIKDIIQAYTEKLPHKDVYWKDSCWKMLTETGAVEKEKVHYQRALNWEAYADHLETNKKENVFNANLHTIYHDAYKQVYEVREVYQEEYKRIRDKYNAAKKSFVEAMSIFGVKTQYVVPEKVIEKIDAQMAQLNLNTIYDVLLCYLQVPFYTALTKLVNKQLEQCMKQSGTMERFFPDSQRLDNDGNVTGSADFEECHKLQVHRYVRATVQYNLISLFLRVKEYVIDYSEGLFYKVLSESRPSFVEEDRVQLWTKAYYYFFKGDVVVTSHLLMPQFEHALHNLLEEIVGDVTKLNENIQNEPTLIGILSQLKPYCNETLYDELEMFFVNGNDVNYRNNLLHGLIWSMDMLKYGHYLFYLSNLLYFSGKKFLTIGDEQRTEKKKWE